MGVVRAARLGRLRRSRAPELAELGVQPGPVDYASGTKGRVPLVFPRWQLPPTATRGPSRSLYAADFTGCVLSNGCGGSCHRPGSLQIRRASVWDRGCSCVYVSRVT